MRAAALRVQVSALDMNRAEAGFPYPRHRREHIVKSIGRYRRNNGSNALFGVEPLHFLHLRHGCRDEVVPATSVSVDIDKSGDYHCTVHVGPVLRLAQIGESASGDGKAAAEKPALSVVENESVSDF